MPAADFYKRSVDASTRPPAADLEPEKKLLVRLAAGAVLSQVNQLSEAIEVLRPTLASESVATDGQKELVVTMLLRIGATALAVGAPEIASQAYSLASEHAADNQQATAMLGEAWAMAIERGDPLAAARKLADFIDKYPEHVDASRAARACAECLKQSGRAEDASAMLADLLRRWPDSESAWEVVASHRDLAVDLVPSAIKRWLIESAETDRLKKLDVSMTVQGLLAASQEKELKAWAKLAQHLAASDQSGQPTSDLLVKLSETAKDADAERLATIMIAPAETVHGSSRSARGGMSLGRSNAALVHVGSGVRVGSSIESGSVSNDCGGTVARRVTDAGWSRGRGKSLVEPFGRHASCDRFLHAAALRRSGNRGGKRRGSWPTAHRCGQIGRRSGSLPALAGRFARCRVIDSTIGV